MLLKLNGICIHNFEVCNKDPIRLDYLISKREPHIIVEALSSTFEMGREN